MRIESLWIEIFRSIRRLRLDGLGAFNVFYGENGAGKSNVLAAMDLVFDAMVRWAPRPAGRISSRFQTSDLRLPVLA